MAALSSITVYASSRNRIGEIYYEIAREIGRILAHERIELVYGGGDVGLMGELARTVHAHGGRVVGVIPEALKAIEGVAYEVADDLIVTETMRERKRIMYERGEAFLALPGGYGTVEEFMEVITLRQLGYHDKPVVILNADGFYNTFLSFLAEIEERGFARPRETPLFRAVTDPGDVLEAFEP